MSYACISISVFEYCVRISHLHHVFQIIVADEDTDMDGGSSSGLYDVVLLASNVWTLCEAMFLQTRFSPPIALQIQDWLRCHICQPLPSIDTLLSHHTPQNEDIYWPTIVSHVLIGDFESVCMLLQRYLDNDLEAGDNPLSELVSAAIELLHRYPYSDTVSQSWLAWNQDAVMILEEAHNLLSVDNGTSTHNNGFLLMLNIIAGKEVIIDACPSWGELLSCRLLYQYASSNSSGDVYNIARRSMIDVGVEEDVYCVMFLDVMSGDASSAMKLMKGNTIEFPSLFPAHLSDFLSHCGALETIATYNHMNSRMGDVISEEESVRETLLCEFVSGLKPVMWQLQVSYLEYCTRYSNVCVL